MDDYWKDVLVLMEAFAQIMCFVVGAFVIGLSLLVTIGSFIMWIIRGLIRLVSYKHDKSD